MQVYSLTAEREHLFPTFGRPLELARFARKEPVAFRPQVKYPFVSVCPLGTAHHHLSLKLKNPRPGITKTSQFLLTKRYYLHSRTLRPGSPPFSGQRRESRFCGESLQSGFVPYRGWSAVYATILNNEVIMQNCSATTTNLLIFNGMMAEQFCSSHIVCMM